MYAILQINMTLITKLYSLYSITTSITLALICHECLNASRLISRNRERLPLHKFFPLFFQSSHSSTGISEFFPSPIKKLRFHCILHTSIQTGLYKEKAFGILIVFNFSSVKSGRTGPGDFDLSTVTSSMEGRYIHEENVS